MLLQGGKKIIHFYYRSAPAHHLCVRVRVRVEWRGNWKETICICSVKILELQTQKKHRLWFYWGNMQSHSGWGKTRNTHFPWPDLSDMPGKLHLQNLIVPLASPLSSPVPAQNSRQQSPTDWLLCIWERETQYIRFIYTVFLSCSIHWGMHCGNLSPCLHSPCLKKNSLSHLCALLHYNVINHSLQFRTFRRRRRSYCALR